MTPLKAFINQSKRLLIIVAELPLNKVNNVKQFLIHCHCPMIIEPLSQLRENPELQSYIIDDNDINDIELSKFTHVLRIGGIPVTSLWRKLTRLTTIKTLSISHLPFTGCPDGQVIQCDYTQLSGTCNHPRPNKNWQKVIQETIKTAPHSEAGMIYQLSRCIPRGSLVYLGNSSPIRMWSRFATRNNTSYQLYGSRGCNGIDGQLSTFLGLAKPDIENWCILGDLTTLYDLSAPWILPQLSGIKIRIVIIHNYGGQLFSRLFPRHPELINSHCVEFEHWASMWHLPITTITDAQALSRYNYPPQTVIVLKPQ